MNLISFIDVGLDWIGLHANFVFHFFLFFELRIKRSHRMIIRTFNFVFIDVEFIFYLIYVLNVRINIMTNYLHLCKSIIKNLNRNNNNN